MEISQNVILNVVFCLRLVHLRVISMCSACSSIYIVVISEIIYCIALTMFLEEQN